MVDEIETDRENRRPSARVVLYKILLRTCTCTFRYGKSNLQGLPTLVVMGTYTLYIHYNPSPLLFYTWFIAVSRQVRLKQYFSYIFWLEQIYKQ